jgi:hypothetical protein
MVRAMLEEDAALPAEQSQADLIKDLAGAAYLAGSDTTVGAVVSFFLAMLVYPDIQAKAQAEVDRVVGKDRLPELEDAENMPYVQAIASECLRWLPVVPLGTSFEGGVCCMHSMSVLNSCPALYYPGRRVQGVPHPEGFDRSGLRMVRVATGCMEGTG